MNISATKIDEDKTALVLKNIEKHFKNIQILKGISLHVRKGEIFGFVGPNGAGKSTTMKIIMNFIRPSRGQVLIFGKKNDDSSTMKKVGFLPEHPYFYTNISGREFLKFLQITLNLDQKEFRERLNYYAEKLEIGWALDKKLSEYSKGMLQRFGFLQVVICEPELFILDEPMSGLDPIGRRLVMNLILELKEKGRTIFFSSHILPDVEKVCDRVAVIVKGKITDIIDKISLSDIEELFMERVKEAGLREVR